jgi:ABC-type lipoprotein release transport system permease subunit
MTLTLMLSRSASRSQGIKSIQMSVELSASSWKRSSGQILSALRKREKMMAIHVLPVTVVMSRAVKVPMSLLKRKGHLSG